MGRCHVRSRRHKQGLFFSESALPSLNTDGDTAVWDRLFTSAMGSPDSFGRQLDGMGGGVSSLSKIVVVAASARDGVDLDYTFGQVSVTEAAVDYSGNCGNLSSGVVPFALSEGLITAADGWHVFRLFNTNTQKLVDVRTARRRRTSRGHGRSGAARSQRNGRTGRLIYPDPAGGRTAGLLPGKAAESITAGGAIFEVSLVDATLPVVIVPSAAIGLKGTESPEEIDANVHAMGMIEQLRRNAAVRMGLCESPEDAPDVVPKVAVVTAPEPTRLLDGTTLAAEEADLPVRMISMGQTHKAVPGTGAMCLAAAAQIPDTIINRIIRRSRPGADTGDEDRTVGPEVRLATPSGVVTAGAVFDAETVTATSLFRTARVLMRGQVAVTD